MSRRLMVILCLAFSWSLLAAACGGDDEGGNGEGGDGGGEGTITIAGEEANDHGSADVAGQDSVELEPDNFYFSPTVLTGEAGQTLTLELHNEGEATHTFTIEDQGVDVEVASGESATAEITFPDSGEVLFICRFHAGQGMRGGLSVG
jgi:plastocyanin